MEKLSWSIRVPLLKNRVILNQFGLALGIPFGILIIVLLIIRAWYGLAIVGATLVLGFLLVMFIFRGTYDVQYMLDNEGITCETQSKQKKRVRGMATATTLIGALTGNPTAAGAGMLAGAGVKRRLLWRRIRKTKYLDRSGTILLYADFGKTTAVFCTKENYMDIRQFIQDMVEKTSANY